MVTLGAQTFQYEHNRKILLG